MVNATLTQKVKASPLVTKAPSVDFTTSSASFVDVTGATVSVPQNYFFGGSLNGKANSNNNMNIQFLLGATVLFSNSDATQVQKDIPTASYKNATGGAATAKWQMSTTGGISATAFANKTVIVYAIYVNGQPTLALKAHVTSIDMYYLKSSSCYAFCVGSQLTDYAIISIQVNALVPQGIQFSAGDALCFFDWDGYTVGVSP